MTVNGVITAEELITTSDQIFKKNFENIESPLDKINKMNAYFYDWRVEEYPEKKFSNDKQIGFLAQDVEEVLPEIVKLKKDGTKGIIYDRITTLLVEGMKEQTNTIECLKDEINNIKENNYDFKTESSYETPDSQYSMGKIEELEIENECLKNEIVELREKIDKIMEHIK